MKKLLVVLLALTLVALPLWAACAPEEVAPPPGPPTPPPKPEPIVIKSVAILPLDDFSLVGYLHFVDLVNKRANGELVIELVGGPEAIPAFDQAMAVKEGVVDMSCDSAGYYTFLVPELGAFYVSECGPWDDRVIGAYELIEEAHNRAGLHYVGKVDTGITFGLYTNVKAGKPEDLAGQKFRTAAMYQPLLEELKVVTVTLPMTDVYTAMQRGEIDGYVFPWSAFSTYALAEVTKYYIDVEFWTSALVLMMNLDKWNSIPKHLQGLITDCITETEYWAGGAFAEIKDREFRLMREGGVEFIEWSPEDAKWFLDMATRVKWEEVKEEMSPESYAKLREMLTK